MFVQKEEYQKVHFSPHKCWSVIKCVSEDKLRPLWQSVSVSDTEQH